MAMAMASEDTTIFTHVNMFYQEAELEPTSYPPYHWRGVFVSEETSDQFSPLINDQHHGLSIHTRLLILSCHLVLVVDLLNGDCGVRESEILHQHLYSSITVEVNITRLIDIP